MVIMTKGKNMNDNLVKISGKVTIITGAATGLGAATARMMSEAGAKVLINHMNGQESLARAVTEECASDSLCYAGDITNDDDCKAIVQAAYEHWGHVDILINNAGINKFVDHFDLDGLSPEDFINMYQVNVIGAFLMIRAVTPIMKEQGAGIVVNVSSAAGLAGGGSSVAYAASKGAINTMTKSLGRALAPEIRVNAVCPAFINTPLFDKCLGHMPEEKKNKWLTEIEDSTPLKRGSSADIIAKSILFLASDLSENVTGQLLNCDGGTLLGEYKPYFAPDQKK